MGAGDGWLSLGLSRAQGQGFTVATRKGRTDRGRRTIKVLKCAGEEPPLPLMPAILPPVGLVLGTCHLSLPTENEWVNERSEPMSYLHDTPTGANTQRWTRPTVGAPYAR